jgi:hypothetical protein
MRKQRTKPLAKKKHLPPVRIPLSFDDVVSGILAVKPK